MKMKPGYGIKFEVGGIEETFRRLNKLKWRTRDRIIKRGIKKGAEVLWNYTRARAPSESGLLKKAIAVKITPTRDKNGFWGTVGIDNTVTGFYQGRQRRPSQYAHLVEFGTAHAPPRAFMRAAFDAGKRRAEQVFRDEVRKSVIRAVGRLAQTGGGK